MADAKIIERTKVGPRCDIYKADDNIILKVEMPGVDKDNIEIRVDGDHLFVEGHKNIKRGSAAYRIKEIKGTDYFQKFTIDSTVDRNKIDAEIKNGLLILKLGIRESEKPRKITVTGV